MTEELLAVTEVDVTFPVRRRFPWQPKRRHAALTGVSLSVRAGETVGLVGESGSGKSTLARVVLGLQSADRGRVALCGQELDVTRPLVPRSFRRSVQAVFQDPYGSLNPTMTVARILAEPLRLAGELSTRERLDRVAELVSLVGLTRRHLERYPYQFSGGQQQRIAIARALACSPKLIVLDEPVSALDVSIQSQVIDLLERIQARTGVSYLFIAHDLAVVRHISHRIAVMYRGRIVEAGPADQVCDQPTHPYTRLLLASILDPDPATSAGRRAQRRRLASALADSLDSFS
jgi:ABC-type glutathione transport system ATPase component